MSQPIIFKITEAGKQAAIDANSGTTTLRLDLTDVAVGAGKYNPTGDETALASEYGRFDIISGGVEVNSHTLRFSANITGNSVKTVSEVGLLTDDGVLFAVASTTAANGFFTIHPSVNFATSFGLSLGSIDADSINVVTDPNAIQSLVIMENHLAAPDPHPQYMDMKRINAIFSQLVPFGYKHFTNDPDSPKPFFDEMLGIDTFWRRLDGYQLVGTDPNDPNISEPSLVVGKKGVTTKPASGEIPDHYPLSTSFIWERYDPASRPVKYDGRSKYDGNSKYQ